jgi:hypothetical protein
MSKPCILYAVVSIAMATTIARADLKSGPNVGVKVGKLNVFATTGAFEGKELDYSAQRKDKPTVYVFVNGEQWGRPMARFLRAIDQRLASGKEKAEAVAVWITEKADETKEYLPKVQQSLQLQTTAMTVAVGDKPRLQDWKINDDAHITVIVVTNGSVAGSFAHQSVNETDAEAVLKLLKKAVGK